MDLGTLGIFAVIVAALFYFNRGSAKSALNKATEQAESKFVSQVNEPGGYDGSAESKKIAEAALGFMKTKTECKNPQTDTLYWETLEQSDLAIPLIVAYAFSVGEFLDNPEFDKECANLTESQKKTDEISRLFPEYGEFVSEKHSGDDCRIVLELSLDLLIDFMSETKEEN